MAGLYKVTTNWYSFPFEVYEMLLNHFTWHSARRKCKLLTPDGESLSNLLIMMYQNRNQYYSNIKQYCGILIWSVIMSGV